MPASRGPDLGLSTCAPSLRIATIDDLGAVATLFDLYRQFYQQEANITLAETYLYDRISTASSIILIAWVGDIAHQKAVGFTQLYPSFCSVDASPIWILYDLFVDPSTRNLGVGKALMARAEGTARDSGASRIDLETAIDNINAPALYEAYGYLRETDFYKYSLAL